MTLTKSVSNHLKLRIRVYHFTALEYALGALKNQRLKVARISELNNPFELLCPPLADRTTRQAFVALKKREAKRSGILCFSKKWSNLLLWSHYADKHRGAALAFEIHPDLITEILYTTRRKTLNVPALTKRGDLAKKDKAIIYATKSQHWEYEEEVRVFVLLKDCIQDGGLYFAPFSRLFRPVGLIAGPLCKVTEAQIAQALPKGESVHLTRSRLAFRSFNVVKNKSFTPVVIHGVGPI